MRRVHIIGGKNHGKTTLIEQLIREFQDQAMCVGTIKHTHHHHELDTPGKDSYRHQKAGAAVVGILSPAMNAVFFPSSNDSTPADSIDERENRYLRLSPLFASCDLVLVEGDMKTPATRIEVWRSALGMPPLAQRDAQITAVVTDDPVDVSVPLWPRCDVTAVARNILDHLQRGPI